MAPRGQRPRPASPAWRTGPTCSGRPSRMRRGTPRRRRHRRSPSTRQPHCGDAVADRLHRYGQQQLGRSQQRQRVQPQPHRQRVWLDLRALEVSTDNGTTWTTTTANQSGLADGTYLFRATVTDAAGNTSTTATQTVTIDTTAPTAGTLSLTGFTDTGSSSSDGLSTTTRSVLSLTGSEAGSTPCSRSRPTTAPRGRRPRPASPAWPTGPTCSGRPSPMRRGMSPPPPPRRSPSMRQLPLRGRCRSPASPTPDLRPPTACRTTTFA